ncbi:hypothetical protein [Clostridium polynesiense]|uniref:hypothetical protein n=1 Tax=Clostridium polynesiense TaxID=1325933 RepID=UPI0005916298|nr:hypothetical protein [Clostridium polynesiense]
MAIKKYKNFFPVKNYERKNIEDLKNLKIVILMEICIIFFLFPRYYNLCREYNKIKSINGSIYVNNEEIEREKVNGKKVENKRNKEGLYNYISEVLYTINDFAEEKIVYADIKSQSSVIKVKGSSENERFNIIKSINGKRNLILKDISWIDKSDEITTLYINRGGK